MLVPLKTVQITRIAIVFFQPTVVSIPAEALEWQLPFFYQSLNCQTGFSRLQMLRLEIFSRLQKSGRLFLSSDKTSLSGFPERTFLVQRTILCIKIAHCA